jgi:hypothetical protein
MAVFILSLLFVGWEKPAASAPGKVKFTLGLNFIGGVPPGAPKQWPIFVDGVQVGVTNNKGTLSITTSAGTHLFKTGMSWTYNKKNYRYAGEIRKNIANNTWSFTIPVQKY